MLPKRRRPGVWSQAGWIEDALALWLRGCCSRRWWGWGGRRRGGRSRYSGRRNHIRALRLGFRRLVLVGHAGFFASGAGRFLFLLAGIAGQAKRSSLGLAIGNLGGIGRRGSHLVRRRYRGLGLLRHFGA